MDYIPYIKPHAGILFYMCYGGNAAGGIFTAACPAEALHALENGLFLHSLKAVLGGCLNHQLDGQGEQGQGQCHCPVLACNRGEK
jgi:hypothetical protein